MYKLNDYGFSVSKMFYVIAEAGINHGGSIDMAKKLIDSASNAGADSIKFQTYITEKRAPKDSPIYDILKKCQLPFEAFEDLNNHAKDRNITFFSTPFDDESVQCLHEIGVEMLKIASFDIVNKELLRKIASTRKTVIMSTGMATHKEIDEALEILSPNIKNLILLHCISSYPTSQENANLFSIKYLQDNFNCLVGHSDHTNDLKVPLYAASMGAQILEKHFMISDDMDCVDAPVSITESQMKLLVEELRILEKIIGKSFIGMSDAEKDAQQFRRPSD